jgi:hypothetical protein
MKKDIEQIFNIAKKESLTKREKLSIEVNLKKLIKNNPLPQTPKVSPYSWLLVFRQHILVTSFAILLVFGGSGSIFAEQALPGDFFYGFKRGINEQIRGWFATSDLNHKEWQLSLAERRLNEIESLSKENRLSSDINDSLSLEIDFHAKEALGESVENLTKDFLPKETTRSSKLEEEPISVDNDVEASIMMATSLDSEVSPDENLMSLSLLDIDNLLKEAAKIKEEIRVKDQLDIDKRSVMQKRGYILIVEKLLIQAKYNFNLNNEFLADEFFQKAKSIMENYLVEENLVDTEEIFLDEQVEGVLIEGDIKINSEEIIPRVNLVE